MVNYLLTSTFIHIALLLSLCYTPDVLTSGANKIEVNIITKSKKQESPPILKNLPPLAKPLIPGQGARTIKKQPEIDIKDYADQIKAIVDPIWVSKIRPIQAHKYQTYEIIVLLSVDKRGRIYNIRVEKSSGVRSYDELAIQTFREIGSIPIPPELVVKEGITWSLVF